MARSVTHLLTVEVSFIQINRILSRTFGYQFVKRASWHFVPLQLTKTQVLNGPRDAQLISYFLDGC